MNSPSSLYLRAWLDQVRATRPPRDRGPAHRLAVACGVSSAAVRAWAAGLYQPSDAAKATLAELTGTPVAGWGPRPKLGRVPGARS